MPGAYDAHPVWRELHGAVKKTAKEIRDHRKKAAEEKEKAEKARMWAKLNG